MGHRTALLLVVLLGACSGARSTLLVDLKTDFVPGVEFVLVRAERLAGPPQGGDRSIVEVLSAFEVVANEGDDYLSGLRIAELTGLPRGEVFLRVSLVNENGQVVSRRFAIIAVRHDTSVTLVLTRTCAGVMCPLADDDPSLTECLGGRCADPRCTPESVEFCPAPSCTTDGDCASAVFECAVPICTEGVCVGRECEVARPDAGSMDAGTVDAGSMDAGTVDAGSMDAGTVGSMDGGADARVPDASAPDAGGGPFVLITFGGAGSDSAEDVVVGADGVVYVTGALTGAVEVGGQVATSAGTMSDAFVAAIPPSGATRWIWSAGGTDLSDLGVAIALSPQDELVAVLECEGTVTLGADVLPGMGNDDLCVVWLDLDGNVVRSWRGGGPGDEEGQGVAVDALGNVYVAGLTQGMVDFGTGNFGGSGRDAFVVSLDSGASVRWVRPYDTPSDDRAEAIALGPSGAVYVAGRFSGSVDFGDGPRMAIGNSDIFVTALDPADGSFVWARTYGSAAVDFAASLAVAPNGTLRVGGRYGDGTDFGDGVPRSRSGLTDAFVVALDPTGNTQWVRVWGGAGVDLTHALAVDGAGRTVAGVEFEGPVDFGASTLTAADQADVALVSVDGTGATVGAVQIGGTLNDGVGALAVAPDGSVIAVGRFEGQADFLGLPRDGGGTSGDGFILRTGAP